MAFQDTLSTFSAMTANVDGRNDVLVKMKQSGIVLTDTVGNSIGTIDPANLTGGMAIEFYFNPDGSQVAVIEDNGGVTLFNVSDQSKVGSTTLPSGATPFQVEFSNDGSRLIIMESTGMIGIIDTSDVSVVGTYNAHDGDVSEKLETALAVEPNTGMVISSSPSTTDYWELSTQTKSKSLSSAITNGFPSTYLDFIDEDKIVFLEAVGPEDNYISTATISTDTSDSSNSVSFGMTDIVGNPGLLTTSELAVPTAVGPGSAALEVLDVTTGSSVHSIAMSAPPGLVGQHGEAYMICTQAGDLGSPADFEVKEGKGVSYGPDYPDWLYFMNTSDEWIQTFDLEYLITGISDTKQVRFKNNSGQELEKVTVNCSDEPTGIDVKFGTQDDPDFESEDTLTFSGTYAPDATDDIYIKVEVTSEAETGEGTVPITITGIPTS